MSDSNLSEVWKPVVGYERFYEVSSLGRIRRLERTSVDARGMRAGRVATWPIKILKPSPGRSGYLRIPLKDESGKRGYHPYVHRLVLAAFVGPCPPGMVGCHNDGNNTNNAQANLRWDTPLANAQDTKRHGTHQVPRGERSNFAILTEASVRDIRARRAAGEKLKPLAKEYGVCISTVSHIVTRRNWRQVT